MSFSVSAEDSKQIDPLPPKIIEAPIESPFKESIDAATVYPAESTVVLKINLSDKGIITDVKVIKSSGYDIFDNSALHSVEKWRFDPAYKDGMAIPCVITVPITFKTNQDAPPTDGQSKNEPNSELK
jgi:protein TonB